MSSHDMLKSVSTWRARDATIDGHTTRLWMPIMNSSTAERIANKRSTINTEKKKHRGGGLEGYRGAARRA